MSRMTIDRGPTGVQAAGADAPVNNMSITIQDRSGPIRIDAVLEIDNTGVAIVAPDVASIAVNGVSVALTQRTHTLGAAGRVNLKLEHVIEAPAVGDIITVRWSGTVQAGHQLLAGASALSVQALPVNAAVMAGIGPATA